MTQTVTPVPALAGTRLNYQITVTNGGPAGAENVVLNPGVPLGATGVLTSTTQGSCVVGSGGLSCSLGSIPAGGAVQATISFLTTATGTLFTTAVVTSSTPDSVIANNSHTIGAVIVPAGQGVDLRLTKTDSIDPVALNAPFTYTLTVTNAGATEATSVVVTDNVPSGIAISYATSPSGMCSAIGSQVLCSFASILPGQTVTMTFNATGTSVGAWTNQASVTSAQVELTPADNVVSETTMVVAAVNCAAPSFSGPTIFAANGPTADVLTGDLNGDGFKDVVAPVPSANSVAVLLGNGTGGFGAPTLYPTGAGTHRRRPARSERRRPARHRARGSGRRVRAVRQRHRRVRYADDAISYAPAIVGDVRAGDFNGDGRPDLAITTLGPNQLHIRLNNGSGAFVETATPIALPGEADRIVIQDLNSDERLDLALSYTSFNGSLPAGRVSILLGDGAGGFGAPATLSLAAGSDSRVFGLGDINGDSHTDLAVIEVLGATRFVYLLFGDGAGSFTSQQLAALAEAFRVEAGDINGDGRKDLGGVRRQRPERVPG